VWRDKRCRLAFLWTRVRAPERGWIFYRIRACWQLGLITRTENTPHSLAGIRPDAWQRWAAAERAFPGSDGRAWRLGSDRTFMAGGERAVQRETVKASRPVFSAGDQPPATRPIRVMALIGQIESITSMTTAALTAPLPSIAHLRKEAAAAIERLIAFLDATEADPDAEPSLGFSNGGFRPEDQPQDGWGFHMNANGGHDEEDEHDGAEPDVDHEPSLGWTHTTNQTATAWAANNLGMIDLEEGVGAVRKARPASKTGPNVRWCAQVLV
jgi:hypothetical protein